LVSLKHVRLSVRKGKVHPKFCDPDLELKLSRARDLLEEKLGVRLGEFNEEGVRAIFSDAKAAEIALAVLMRFYSFQSPSMADIFGKGDLDRLSMMEIRNPMDLRLRFFEYLSTHHSGFMSSESRPLLLREFADHLEIDPARLEEALWLDEEDQRILARKVDHAPTDLAAVYNFEILATLLANSYSLRIGPLEEGSPTKFVFRNLKLYGLLFETLLADDGFVFEVDGPLTIFGKASKFGYRMAILLFRLQQLWKRKGFACPLSVELRKSKRRVVYESEISKMPEVLWPNVADLAYRLFDSKIEAKIYSTFKVIDLNGWQIEREPRPFVSDGTVFIPDFSLTRGKDEVFVEVIGFWTPEYRKRKRAKLQKMEHLGLENLMLIVDEKMAGDFAEITRYPVFTYKRVGGSYKVPYGRILGFLDSRFPRKESEARLEKKPTEPKIVEHLDGKYRVFW